MTCHIVQKLLPLHSGGDLPRWKARLVERHLSHCGNCRFESESLRKTRSLTAGAFRDLDCEVAEDRLRKRVFSALSADDQVNLKKPGREKTQRRIFVTRLASTLAVTAAFLALLMVSENSRNRLKNWMGFEGTKTSFPVIENVGKAGVTVMTFKTDDPKVTIVWLFEENQDTNEK